MTLMTAYLNEVAVEMQILILLCIYLRFAAKSFQPFSGPFFLAHVFKMAKMAPLLKSEREAEHGDKGARGYASVAHVI